MRERLVARALRLQFKWFGRGNGRVLAGLLLLLHLGLVIDGARQHAPAFDELNYATRGYVTLTTGDQQKTPEHPPSIMLLLGASYLGTGIDVTRIPGFHNLDGFQFGQNFVYRNAIVSPKALLFRSRLPVALLSVLAGIAVFGLARHLAGEPAGIAALAVYALDPLIVAHAGLATLDLGAASLALLAAGCLPWALHREKQTAVGLAVAGGVLGLALTAKLSTLPSLLGTLATAGIVLWRCPRPSRKAIFLRVACVFAVAALTTTLVCLPQGPTILLKALKIQMKHASMGHPAFAFGHYGKHGWWWYYPAAWIVKTPIPILILTGAGLPAMLWCWRRSPEGLTSLLVPTAGLALAAVFSPIAIGVRNLLPMVPVLAVGAGVACAKAWSRSFRVRPLLLGLFAWLLVNTLRAHPFELSFINEAAGGWKAGPSLLADSNIDWGLDLGRVRTVVSRQPLRTVYLGYFGSAVPSAHGLPRYRWMPSFNLAPRVQLDGDDPNGREWIAISSTILTGVYPPGRDVYAWLKDRVPTEWAGRSILLFDITGDSNAHFQLGQAALNVNYLPGASAAFSRATELAPEIEAAWVGRIRAQSRSGGPEGTQAVCRMAQVFHPSLRAFALCRDAEPSLADAPGEKDAKDFVP